MKNQLVEFFGYFSWNDSSIEVKTDFKGIFRQSCISNFEQKEAYGGIVNCNCMKVEN